MPIVPKMANSYLNMRCDPSPDVNNRFTTRAKTYIYFHVFKIGYFHKNMKSNLCLLAMLHGNSVEGPFHVSESESFGNLRKCIGNSFFKNFSLKLNGNLSFYFGNLRFCFENAKNSFF